MFLPHPQIFAAVEPGHTLLLDDGKIRMTVIDKTSSTIEATVQVGGMLASRKGISLPDTVLPVGPLTDKDKADLDYALRLGVDWVALSFVQRGDDVKLARQIIGQAAAIMSKIEKPAAIADLDAVIAHSDGLMVARGDLGRGDAGRARADPAEADHQQGARRRQAGGGRHADAGEHDQLARADPSRGVRCGHRRVRRRRCHHDRRRSRPSASIRSRRSAPWTASPSRWRAIPATAPSCTRRARRRWPPPPMPSPPPRTPSPTPLKLAGIICYTATGSTALRVARERPGLPVIGLSPVVATGRKLAMAWGVHCVLTSDPENQAAMVRKACRIAFDEGFAKAGEGVIIVAGVPLGSPGTTNMIRIAYLDDAGNPVAEGA